MAAGIKMLVPGEEKTSGACKILHPLAQPLQGAVPEPLRSCLCCGGSLRLGKDTLSCTRQQKSCAEEENLPEPWGSSVS